MGLNDQERVTVHDIQDLDSFLRLLNPHLRESQSETAKPIWSRRKAYTLIAMASLFLWGLIIWAGFYLVSLIESL